MRNRLVVVVLPFAILGVSCPGRGEVDPPAPGAVTQAEADEVVAGLCEMTGEFRDDVTGGRTVFYDRVHERLHTIAAEAQDPAAAGSLLEAKQLVEADLDAPGPPSEYVQHVDELLRVVRDAVALIGLDDRVCPS